METAEQDMMELEFEGQLDFGDWILRNFAPEHTNTKAGHACVGMSPLLDKATVVCRCGATVTISYEDYLNATKRAA